MPDLMRPKWILAGVGLGVVIVLGAGIVGDVGWGPRAGVTVAGDVFSVLLFVIAGPLAAWELWCRLRSDPARSPGIGPDERFQMVDLRALAYTGLAMLLAVMAAFFFEVAHGRNGLEYIWLVFVAMIVYFGSVIYLRSRG
jgi:hypothetical protein